MMASKFLKSSIVLLLARGALGATDVAQNAEGARPAWEVSGGDADQKYDEGQPEPKKLMLPKEIFLGARGYKNTNMKAVVTNRDMVVMDIMEFVAQTAYGLPYKELSPEQKRQIIIIGWSGMCFCVDGRCEMIPLKPGEKGNRAREEKEKRLPCCAKRTDRPRGDEHSLEKVIIYPANKILETPEFEAMMKGISTESNPNSAYYDVRENPEEIKEFFDIIGDCHYCAASGFKIGKAKQTANWTVGHPYMQGRHYQVDVGSGKSSPSFLTKKGTAKGYKDGRTTYLDEPEAVLKLLKKGGAKSVESATKMLQKIANEMLGILKKCKEAGNLCNDEDTLPTAAFGLTGIWRKENNPYKAQMFSIFKNAIEVAFAGTAVPNVFEVKHVDEAQYGTESFALIPDVFDVLREGGFRIFVSLEGGKNSTQVGITDLRGDLRVTEDVAEFQTTLLRDVEAAAGAAEEEQQFLRRNSVSRSDSDFGNEL